jgi:hypothetical protein
MAVDLLFFAWLQNTKGWSGSIVQILGVGPAIDGVFAAHPHTASGTMERLELAPYPSRDGIMVSGGHTPRDQIGVVGAGPKPFTCRP